MYGDDPIFDEELDEFIEAILMGRASLADIVADRPEIEDALFERLPDAAIRRFAMIESMPPFRSTLRERLLEDGANAVAPAPIAHPRFLRMRSVKIALVAAVLIALLTGFGIAATSSRPGSPLYPIKRVIERIGLSRQPEPATEEPSKTDLAPKRSEGILKPQPAAKPAGAETDEAVEQEQNNYEEEAEADILNSDKTREMESDANESLNVEQENAQERESDEDD